MTTKKYYLTTEDYLTTDKWSYIGTLRIENIGAANQKLSTHPCPLSHTPYVPHAQYQHGE